MRATKSMIQSSAFDSNTSFSPHSTKIKPYSHQTRVELPMEMQPKISKKERILCNQHHKNVHSLKCCGIPTSSRADYRLRSLKKLRLTNYQGLNRSFSSLTSLDISLKPNLGMRFDYDAFAFNKIFGDMKNLERLFITLAGTNPSLTAIKRLRRLKHLKLMFIKYDFHEDLSFLADLDSLETMHIHITELKFDGCDPISNQPQMTDLITKVLSNTHLKKITVKIFGFLTSESLTAISLAARVTSIPNWNIRLQIYDIFLNHLFESNFPFDKLDFLALYSDSVKPHMNYMHESEPNMLQSQSCKSLGLCILETNDFDLSSIINACPSLVNFYFERTQSYATIDPLQCLAWAQSIKNLVIIEHQCSHSELSNFTQIIQNFKSLKSISYDSLSRQPSQPIITSLDIKMLVEASSHIGGLKSFRVQGLVLDVNELKEAQALLGNMKQVEVLTFNVAALSGESELNLPLNELRDLRDLKVKISSNLEKSSIVSFVESVVTLKKLEFLEIIEWELNQENIGCLRTFLQNVYTLETLTSFMINIKPSAVEAFKPDFTEFLNPKPLEERIKTDPQISVINEDLKRLSTSGHRLKYYEIKHSAFERQYSVSLKE